MSDNDELEETDLKKRPGRPKKESPKKTIPKEGIVENPSNLHISDPRMRYSFELLYDNPIMFRKIFSLFKSMAVDNIRIRLEKQVIKMHAIDHSFSNHIYIQIYGNKMNRYYTSRVMEFGLNPLNIQKILQTLNKDYIKIYWFTTVHLEKSKIMIGLSNDDLEEDSIYTIEQDQLETYDWQIETQLELEKKYPLKFELPFKHFKKKVTDFKLLGDIMKIEKEGNKPLKLSYNFSNSKGNQTTIFKCSEKINLKSSIKPDEIFSVSVCLDYIKPLAGTLISDSIQISADIDQNIIFTSFLDQDEKPSREKIPDSEKCMIKIITKNYTVNN